MTLSVFYIVLGFIFLGITIVVGIVGFHNLSGFIGLVAAICAVLGFIFLCQE